jgi:hypothetical protein
VVDQQESQLPVGITEGRQDPLEIDMELHRRDTVSGSEPMAVETISHSEIPAAPQQ